jgi:hypothetical protein
MLVGLTVKLDIPVSLLRRPRCPEAEENETRND